MNNQNDLRGWIGRLDYSNLLLVVLLKLTHQSMHVEAISGVIMAPSILSYLHIF